MTYITKLRRAIMTYVPLHYPHYLNPISPLHYDLCVPPISPLHYDLCAAWRRRRVRPQPAAEARVGAGAPLRGRACTYYMLLNNCVCVCIYIYILIYVKLAYNIDK